MEQGGQVAAQAFPKKRARSVQVRQGWEKTLIHNSFNRSTKCYRAPMPNSQVGSVQGGPLLRQDTQDEVAMGGVRRV